MRTSLLLTLMSLALMGYAQKFTLKGQLTDSSGAALASATVLVLNPKDSSLVNFGVSNSHGFFEIKNLNRANYLFRVTFVGYAPLTVPVSPKPDELIVDLGLLKMQPESRVLDEVTIRAERAPVVVKRDTIEFNAASFRTRPNAMVEDLLKQLPSVEVDNDGTIRAQGEQVQRVTVDGREFFGRDPKLATRNLPADAIDKVQVFDRQSDQAQFTGIDDGQREKTINLELKEEKRNGAFGNLTGGVGTDDRFNARASVNRFAKGNQLSVIGMGNNVNEQGFSIGDYMNFTGGSQQMMSGGGMQIQINQGGASQGGPSVNMGGRSNGIMTNYAGGINFNNTYGKTKNTQLNGNYFYNYLDHFINQNTFRENFLPNGTFNFDQLSLQNNNNQNHRSNLNLDHKIDSANSIRWTNAFSYNTTDTRQQSQSTTFTPDGEIQNTSENVSLASGSTLNFNSNFLYRHRFKKKGRTISTNLSLNLINSDREGSLNAINTFFTPVFSENVINQVNSQVNDNLNYGGTVSYTEPLGNRKYLEANYNFSQNINNVDRQVYDVVNEELIFNNPLSNKFSSNYTYQRAGLNFRMNRQKYSFTVGANFQSTNLKGNLETLNATIGRTFNNALPVARFSYEFSSTKRFSLDYETSVREPSVQQLQPVIDNSDPLNIYVGNPNLKPSYNQSWRFRFTTFNPANFISFFLFGDVDYTTNAITNAQFVDEQLVRTTTPVNVDNNFSAMGNATLSFPITKLKSRVSIGGNARNMRTINWINLVESQIDQFVLGGNLRYNFRWKEIFDLNLNSQLSRQKTDYEFDQPDQLFFNQTYTAESNVNFLKNYNFNANFDYLVYKSESTDFRETIPLLNMSVSRFLLKNKTGELKLSVNNLLDQNLGITQTATSNYFERRTMNALGRYFMVSFTYALNKHLNPMGAVPRGGGRMFQMIRQ
ncbi:MAG: outer membrane beta-barrel protein [Cyclobacteriaceae bacterium]|nr:outer membrane beta-barrel protein [Cyclobacteriaceae bacterium]